MAKPVISKVQPEVAGRIHLNDDGTFDPSDPEIVISGYGILSLSKAKQKLKRDLAALSERTAGNGPGEFQSILHLIDRHSIIQTFTRAIYDVYHQLQDPQIKRKITRMRKMSTESAKLEVTPLSQPLSLLQSVLEITTPQQLKSNIADELNQISYSNEKQWRDDCDSLRYHTVESHPGIRKAYARGGGEDVPGEEMGTYYVRDNDGYLYVPVEFKPDQGMVDSLY